MGKISLRQEFFSWACKRLAGGRNEERATNLLPQYLRIGGVRLWLFKRVARLRYLEGQRLVRKYHTHVFESR